MLDFKCNFFYYYFYFEGKCDLFYFFREVHPPSADFLKNCIYDQCLMKSLSGTHFLIVIVDYVQGSFWNTNVVLIGIKCCKHEKKIGIEIWILTLGAWNTQDCSMFSHTDKWLMVHIVPWPWWETICCAHTHSRFEKS